MHFRSRADRVDGRIGCGVGEKEASGRRNWKAGIATEPAGEKRAGRARGEDGHEFGLRLLSLRHQFDIQTKMLNS